jgi:predicted RND superfamily exporter protein
MWYKIADVILKCRILFLVVVVALTGFFGYQLKNLKMSYTFTNSIPTDNPKYQAYQNFIKTYGVDGNTVMIGFETDDLFTVDNFEALKKLTNDLKQVPHVVSVLAVNKAIYIHPDTVSQLGASPIFVDSIKYSAQVLDSLKNFFFQLPFYKGLLYNKEANAYLMAINLDKVVMKTPQRKDVMEQIANLGEVFSASTGIETHYSGLPYIRTKTADLLQHELVVFLILSFVLTALIIYLFFRSFSAVLLSMLIVGVGVVWAMGMLPLFGYEVTSLTGCIPPLIVVIAIPNCIYILNSYHQEYAGVNEKIIALKNMVGKMGIITLFTNLTTAIGFGVFAFTNSIILKEFGLITGINSIILFVITLIVLPILLSYLPAPKIKHTNYLDSKWLNAILDTLSKWVVNNRKAIYLMSGIVLVFSIMGIMRLKQVGFIVDDLPKGDKVVTDLKFFEKNFKGVMPLEIIINTQEKYGALKSLDIWERVDSLNNLMMSRPEIGGGLNLVKAVKFARQGMMDNVESEFVVPNGMEFSSIRPMLISTFNKQQEGKKDDDTKDKNMVADVMSQYLDSTAQSLRLSVNVADIGSVELPKLIAELEPQSNAIFEGTDATVTFTGTSITFIEGSKFIINSLGESLAWAFGMIIVCMLILFRSLKMTAIAMLANLIPIAMTAGIMGWLNIPLKPSTVLVFSVALGICVDVTIRFMTNIQQRLKENSNLYEVVLITIRETGMSIIATTAILVFGFGVFAVSAFDGTKALGYLSALTLFLAMVFNLTLQPALLLWYDKTKKKNNK